MKQVINIGISELKSHAQTHTFGENFITQLDQILTEIEAFRAMTHKATAKSQRMRNKELIEFAKKVQAEQNPTV